MSTGLVSELPAPKRAYNQPVVEDESESKESTVNNRVLTSSSAAKTLPSYPNRQGFVPIAPDDFGDGGAYPEIHVVQYPLNMGKPGLKSTALVPVQVDEKGVIKTDMLAKQGSNKNKIVHTKIDDLKEKRLGREQLALPSAKEEEEAAERTRRALEVIVEGKIKSAKPTTLSAGTEVAEPTYVRYTPSVPGNNNAVGQQRIIKMVQAQVDPLEPPKHKHMSVVRGPPSPPVPVLHSPPRKLTVADQQAWKIPPCISNWKNARGFIIPLDKRLAADGRGLQEVTINNKFAMLSESLYIAERKAVEDLNVRNELRKKIALREKEEREQNLREMANRARLERSGLALGGLGGGIDSRIDRGNNHFDEDEEDHSDDQESIEGFVEETEEEKIARQQRERARIERRKERERELRLENMKGNLRKSKLERDEGRDISEKIALGMLKGTGKLTGEAAFDSRLFNQSSGMDAGFGAEDEYNTYSRPLFDRGEAASIYRPKKADAEQYGDVEEQLAKLRGTSRFKPDKGFKGAEGGGYGGPRDAPVEFERARDVDPFAREQVRDRRSEDRDEDRNRDNQRKRPPSRSPSRSPSPSRAPQNRREELESSDTEDDRPAPIRRRYDSSSDDDDRRDDRRYDDRNAKRGRQDSPSPPRRRQASHSPPRRRQASPSPPRRRQDSPPRRRQYRDDSPPRRRRDSRSRSNDRHRDKRRRNYSEND